MCVCVCVCVCVSHSVVSWPFTTPWTVAWQAPLSMEFSRREYWSGLPFPSPRDLPDPGIKHGSPLRWLGQCRVEDDAQNVGLVSYCRRRGALLTPGSATHSPAASYWPVRQRVSHVFSTSMGLMMVWDVALAREPATKHSCMCSLLLPLDGLLDLLIGHELDGWLRCNLEQVNHVAAP